MKCVTSVTRTENRKTKTPPKRGFAFRGADTQSRTGDLTLTKGALYQLSHISTYLVRYPV